MIKEDALRTFLRTQGIELLIPAVAEGGSAFLHKAKVTTTAPGLPPAESLIAVKEFKDNIVSQQSQRHRIEVESDLGKSIDHPNFVRTYGLIGAPKEEGDPYLLALEWLDGTTLENFLKGNPDIDWDTRKSFSLSITDAVEHLHSKQVFHRDLKTENIFVLNDRSIKVMDLGISLPFDDETRTRHTAVKEFIGSARFASPQFLAGEAYTSSDDVYALGTVLFHLFTGESVYSDVVRKPMILVRVMSAPPKIQSLAPEVPDELRYVIDGCLHHDPALRPTLEQLKEALALPATASYVVKEKLRRTRTLRGSPVVSVFGDNIYVGGELAVGRTLNIVRTRKIFEERYAEAWVATVRVMHSHDGISHCVTLKQKWVESQTFLGLAQLVTRQGHFEYTDPEPLAVLVGDRAVDQY